MTEEIIQEIFTTWKEVLSHPRAVLDKKRRKVISERLKDGFTVEDLKLVPLGVKNSKWHMGENPRGLVYDSIGLIYRDSDHVEKFIDLAEEIKDPIPQITCQFCDWHNQDPNVPPCDRHQI